MNWRKVSSINRPTGMFGFAATVCVRDIWVKTEVPAIGQEPAARYVLAIRRVGKGALAPCPPSSRVDRPNGGHGAKGAPLPTLRLRDASRDLIHHDLVGDAAQCLLLLDRLDRGL